MKLLERLEVSLETPRWVLVFTLIFSLAGMLLIAYSTTWGPVITSDGVYYIGSADNLVKGIGFGLPWGSGRFLRYAGNPPFYPFLVVGLELLGLNVVDAARWVCILAFGFTIFAAGWLGYRASRSPTLAVCLSAFLLTSALMAEMYAYAMSEPVFYAVGLAGALWLLVYLESKRLGDLLGASLLISAAFLTRFPGVALVLAGGLSLLLLSRLPWRTCLAHAGLYALIIGLPMGLWLGYSYTVSGELGERTPGAVQGLWQASVAFRLKAAQVLYGYLPWASQFPADYDRQKNILAVLALVIFVFAGLAFFRSRRLGAFQEQRFLWRWGAFFLLYGGLFMGIYFTAFAVTLPTPDLDWRLFSPFYLAAACAVFGLLVLLGQVWSNLRPLRALPWLLLVVFVAANLPLILQNARAFNRDGRGYTGRAWSESPVLALVRTLPPGTPIITNEADAVLFLTGRPAVWLPDVIASQPAQVFTRFGDSPQNSREEISFRERGAALVLFPAIISQLYGIYGDQAELRLQTLTDGLFVLAEFPMGQGIYFYQPPQR